MRNPDTWRALVEVDSPYAETAAYALAEIRCLGAIEEPMDAKGMVRFIAFFNSREYDKDELCGLILNSFKPFPELRSAYVEVTFEPYHDWNKKWREHFKPFAMAEGIVVTPSWEQYEKKPGELLIHLDPGMAFGTGLHETTRLCAEGLLMAVADKPRADLKLLDIGTGSGILAILARKLGIENVTAVDNDPDALIVALENMKINNCADIRLQSGLHQIVGEFDIAIANILLSTLMDLHEEIASRVAPDGLLLLSGITHDQEQTIAETYAVDFDIIGTDRKGEWSCIAMKKATGGCKARKV